MSRKTHPARAAAISGSSLPADLPPAAAPHTVLLRERSGTRLVPVAHISQLIHHPGMRNPHHSTSPWFVRIDGQELGISPATAETIAQALGCSLAVFALPPSA